MPLVAAICTQCGSQLEIDSTKEAAICPFCSTPFVTETAINNYNTTNVTNIGKLHADVINVSDESSIDNRVKAGETFLKLGEYRNASEVFEKLTEECPYDYRGWWGRFKAEAGDLSNLTHLRSFVYFFSKYEQYFEKACAVAKPEEKEKLTKEYEQYVGPIKNKYLTFKNELKTSCEKIKKIEEEHSIKLKHINDQRAQIDSEKPEGMSLAIVNCVFTVILVIAFILLVVLNAIAGVRTGDIGGIFFGLFFFGIIAVVLFFVGNCIIAAAGAAIFGPINSIRSHNFDKRNAPKRSSLDEQEKALNKEKKDKIHDILEALSTQKKSLGFNGIINRGFFDIGFDYSPINNYNFDESED